MKTIKAVLALLLALLTVLSLSACGALDRKIEILSGLQSADGGGEASCLISRYTTTIENQSEYGSSSITYSYEYDSRGLAAAADFIVDGEALRLTIDYTLDERDNPESVSSLVMGMGIRMRLENRYENGRLSEAVITELAMGDDTAIGPGLDDGAAQAETAAGLLMLTLPAIQHFTGYRDCSLSAAGLGTLIRYENGRPVYLFQPQGRAATETVTAYADDGGVTVTDNSYQVNGEEKTLITGITAERDGKRFLRRMEIRNPDGSAVTLGFRCEDAGSNPEGEAQRRAVIDEITAAGGPGSQAASAEKNREQILGREIELYTLDAAGRVKSCRRSMVMDSGDPDYYTETTSWYNEQGLVTRTEQLTRTGAGSYRTVTETEYR